MNLRQLSDLCLLVLLAAAGSVQRFPVGHQTCADTALVTTVNTPAKGLPASKHPFPKPAGWFEAQPSTKAVNCDKTWRNA